MTSKEVTSTEHAAFLAAFQAKRQLTQLTNSKNVPPMTYWQGDRGQVIAIITHDTKLGDRYFVCTQLDNKTADTAVDTLNDVAMKAAAASIGVIIKADKVAKGALEK